MDCVALSPVQEMRQQQFSKMDAMRSSAFENWIAWRSCAIGSLSTVARCDIAPEYDPGTEISEAMNNQMELLRKQSQVELESLRASVEKSQQESERVPLVMLIDVCLSSGV